MNILDWPSRDFAVILLLCHLIGVGCRAGEVVKDPISFEPGFVNQVESDSVISIGLSFDWDSLGHHLEDEKKIPALMTLENLKNLPIQISSRGVTRKKICDFPPLHIYLPDSLRTQHHWGRHKKYKLVTHCSNQGASEDLILREYLVYRLYNLLTPYSFKVQLCQATYTIGKELSRHPAFLIEDEDELAERLNGKVIKEKEGSVKQVSKEHYQQLVLFQYMVGNTDWNLTRRHNIRFIDQEENDFAIPVPYDFDYSGLVNAPYAFPHPSLPIKNVRERLWQYRGTEKDDFTKTSHLFIQKKKEFLALLDSLEALQEDVRTDLKNYLLSFYSELESNPPAVGIRKK